MVEIIPAILQPSLGGITSELSQITNVTRMVQLDVVDGIFAPERSWPYTPSGKEEFAAICSGTEGLPLWEDFDFEADLMVKESVRDAKQWVSAGASRIVIHRESPDALPALHALQPSRHSIYPITVGVALPSTSSPQVLTDCEDLFDYVQVMGIAHIGRQGEPFDRRALSCIKNVRAAYPAIPVQIDGGVKEETIKELLDAGATRFVVGSAIFAHGNPASRLQILKEKTHTS